MTLAGAPPAYTRAVRWAAWAGGLAGALLACVTSVSRFYIRDVAHQTYRVHSEQTDYDVANGLTAVLLRDRGTDLVEVDMRYLVGSRDDPPGKEGLAHLVEHLMFTQRVGGPDKPTLGTRLRERSLYANALTSEDYTHYQALARADRL